MAQKTTEDFTLSAAYRAIAVTFQSLVWKSKSMGAVLREAERVARTTVNCLLLGETGTGKNLIAQAIHNASPRAGGPFVSLNCSAIPDSLIESELFGAEAGAYTGNDRTRKGRFEVAHGGTLFLDEIGDLSAQAQAKILHAIEYKEFNRVGGEKTLTSDVRIIAATNLSLTDRVEQSLFRRDLLYRLNECELTLPPLRTRPEDIAVLADHFLVECREKYARDVRKLDKNTLKILQSHTWPGNVRELRGVIKRGVARCEGSVLTLEDLQLRLSLVDAEEGSLKEGDDLSLAAAEKRHIRRVLRFTGWNKSEAARLMDISRPRLDRKIESFGLSEEDPA